MLGKGEPPNLTNFTTLSPGATPGKPYLFTAKTAAGTESAGWYFFRWIARLGD